MRREDTLDVADERAGCDRSGMSVLREGSTLAGADPFGQLLPILVRPTGELAQRLHGERFSELRDEFACTTREQRLQKPGCDLLRPWLERSSSRR